MDRKFVVIAGLPGSGKSWLGHQLAPLLGLPLIDKDDILELRFKTKGVGDSAWRRGLICVYKFLYVWMGLWLPGRGPEKDVRERSIAWMYWLPNPLLRFIWFRVALPGEHPHLIIEQF
jgi:hypothetical protein